MNITVECPNCQGQVDIPLEVFFAGTDLRIVPDMTRLWDHARNCLPRNIDFYHGRPQ